MLHGPVERPGDALSYLRFPTFTSWISALKVKWAP